MRWGTILTSRTVAGPNTRRALRDLLRANELEVDGYVGSSAYDAVKAAGVSK